MCERRRRFGGVKIFDGCESRSRYRRLTVVVVQLGERFNYDRCSVKWKESVGSVPSVCVSTNWSKTVSRTSVHGKLTEKLLFLLLKE